MNQPPPPGPTGLPPVSPEPPREAYPPRPQERVALALPNPRPVVTYAILFVTIGVFLLQLYIESTTGQDLLVVYGAKYAPAIQNGEWWRLITPVLLHAGLVHIAFNMYALFALGPQLEKTYGHLRFLTLYVLGGFAGNVLSFIFSPGISVGSSTAIFGLLAAEGFFVYQNRRFFGSRSQSILLNIIGIAAINLLIGQTVPGIDNWGHLGGLLGGGLFASLAGPVWEVEGTPPNLRLVDRRDPLQVQLAALGVLVLFGGLAGYYIYFR